MKAWMLDPVAQTLSLAERAVPEPGPQLFPLDHRS